MCVPTEFDPKDEKPALWTEAVSVNIDKHLIDRGKGRN